MKLKVFYIAMLTLLATTLCDSQSIKTSSQWYHSGMEKFNHKDIKGAITDFTAGIAIDHKSDSSYAMRGSSKYALKDYKGAIDDYTKAVNMNPINKNFLMGRGLAYLRNGQKEKAMADLRIAKALGAPVSAKDWKECQEKR